MDRLGSFQIFVGHVEASGDHTVDSLVRQDLVFDGQRVVVLIAEKSIELEQLVEIDLRDSHRLRGGSILLIDGDLDLAHDERNIRDIFDAEIEHGDAIVVTEGAGADFEDLAFELQVGAFVGVEDGVDGDSDQEHTDGEENQKLFAHRVEPWSVSQEFADAMPTVDIVADRFDAGGQRNGEQQSDGAPQR